MLQLYNLEKYYYDKLILRIPEFTLTKGVTWISGINGSGKTTLLKIITGMIPFDGEVILNDINLKKQPVKYRRLVSFGEAEPLYPYFITGNDLLLYYKEIRKASDANVEELVTFSGLGTALSNPVGTYSSGMVKRLSLLLTFLGHTPLIVLDEPLATLDAEAVDTLPGLINEYSNKYGSSFIFSSHQSPPSSLNIAHRFTIDNQEIHTAS